MKAERNLQGNQESDHRAGEREDFSGRDLFPLAAGAGTRKESKDMTEQTRSLESFRDQTRSLEEYRRAVIVIMADKGRPAADIADVLGVSRAHVYNCLKLHRRDGINGLRASRRRGRPPVVNPDFKQELRKAHARPPQEYGFTRERWTLSMLRDHMHRTTGLFLSLEHIRRLLSEPGTPAQ